MTTEKFPAIRHAVRNVLFGAGALAAGVAQSSLAQAQAAPPKAGASGELEEIVITGSRIASPSLASVSQVTAITAEEIKSTGKTRIEDLLNSLPQVVADQGSGLSMGTNGTATLNLRGLGTQRTLVLINGRRLQGGDPGANFGASPAFASAADINQIPVALVERVDVLTGGASATYGADAVAGVVNFIMNDHFEGIRVDANVGIYNHSNHNPWINGLLAKRGFPTVTGSNWDGANKDITVIMGHNFADGAGNMTAYLGYRNSAPATADHRDHAACVLDNGLDLTGVASPYVCFGSSNSAPAVWFGADGGTYQIRADGTVSPTRYARFNFAASHYLQRQDERYTAGFFGKMKFNEHVEAYTEFTFMDDNTRGNYAPAGAFLASGQAVDADTGLGDGNLTVNCGVGGYGNAGMNPYLTLDVFNNFCLGGPYTNATNSASATPLPAYQILPNGDAQLLLGRRNVEGGPRQENFTHTEYRGVFGLRGKINENWNYDAYGLFAQTRSSDFHNNDTSTSRIQNALLAVKDANGNIVCRGGEPGCVPWNIWNPTIPITPDQIKYISVPGLFEGLTEEDIVSGYVSGDLTSHGIKTPWADGGLKVVFGTEYRRDRLVTRPDQEFQSADLAGFGSPVPPVNAAANVFELFTEARLPLVRDAAWAKSLDFETGYRYSDYTVGFSTNTFKFGLEWAPTSDVRLRASYNRAVRVPNLQELFQPQHVGLDSGGDVCSQTNFSAADCALTGLDPTKYPAPASPASQYNGLIGGNPNLQPEVAKTTGFGIVFTPSFVPGLSATLDYSDIKISNLVNSYGPNLIQANCIASGSATSSWCQLIHRDLSGSLWTSPQAYTIDPLLNEGDLENESIDLGLAYRFKLGSWGGLRTRLDAGFLLKLLNTPGFGASYDCKGRFGPSCSPATPTYRHRLSLDWDTPRDGLSIGATWRYFGSTTNSLLDPKNPDYVPGFGTPPDAYIAKVGYLDLRASYTWNKLVVRLGIDNALDKDPPVIDTQNSGGNQIYAESNTYPSLYDTLGRYVFLNVTADF